MCPGVSLNQVSIIFMRFPLLTALVTKPLLIKHSQLLMQSLKAPTNPRRSIIRQLMLIGQVWLIRRRFVPST